MAAFDAVLLPELLCALDVKAHKVWRLGGLKRCWGQNQRTSAVTDQSTRGSRDRDDEESRVRMGWMLAGLRKFSVLVGSFSRRTLDGIVQQMSWASSAGVSWQQHEGQRGRSKAVTGERSEHSPDCKFTLHQLGTCCRAALTWNRPGLELTRPLSCLQK